MAARADVPRAPVRSGLGEIRGLTFLSLVIRDEAREAEFVERRSSRHQLNAITSKLEHRITRLAAVTARNQEDVKSILRMVSLPHGGPA